MILKIELTYEKPDYLQQFKIDADMSPRGFVQWLTDYVKIRIRGKSFFMPYVGKIKKFRIKKIIWRNE